MKIFLSYNSSDRDYAKDLADLLSDAGNEVFDPEQDLVPGENWSLKIGEALQRCEAMVMLISPKSLESPWMRRELEFALGASNYDQRLIPVLVRPTNKIPWILRKFPLIRGEKSRAEVSREIVNQLRKVEEAK